MITESIMKKMHRFFNLIPKVQENGSLPYVKVAAKKQKCPAKSEAARRRKRKRNGEFAPNYVTSTEAAAAAALVELSTIT